MNSDCPRPGFLLLSGYAGGSSVTERSIVCEKLKVIKSTVVLPAVTSLLDRFRQHAADETQMNHSFPLGSYIIYG